MMKTAMINASPKLVMQNTLPSASHSLIQIVKRSLRRNHIHDIEDFHIKTGKVPNDEMRELLNCETWILSFPIYSGGIPAHLMQFLESVRNLSTSFPEKGRPTDAEHPIRVYALANGGLYDGNEAQVSFEILEHWCRECGFVWGSGLGVGGGPTFSSAHNVGDRFRLRRSFSRSLLSFSMAVSRQTSAGNFYCSPNIRKGAYVIRMNRLAKRLGRQLGSL